MSPLERSGLDIGRRSIGIEAGIAKKPLLQCHFSGRSAEPVRSWRSLLLLGLRVIRCDLALILVEVERGVKLRLLQQKLLQTLLVLERAVELLPVFGKRLLLPLDFLAFLLLPCGRGCEARARCSGWCRADFPG